MRILVTGGAGYVGSASVERFLEAGHEVVVVDDLSTGHRAAVPGEATFAGVDYGDQAAMTALFERVRPDAILHCAARSLVGESVRDPARYYRANVVGGVALLEAARAADIRRLVFSSTAAIYGIPESTPIVEDAAHRPINPYGETKRTFEGALRWYAAAYGLRAIALRYFNVAGATAARGEAHDPETHLIPTILRAAEGAIDLTIFGADFDTPDGTGVRDYIHVADLADAHLAALEATAPGGATGAGPRARGATGAGAHAGATGVGTLGREPLPPDGAFEAFNLGNGGGFSVLEVLRVAEAVVGRPIRYAVGPRRAGDPPVLVASAARAAEVLGWHPRRPTLDEMVGSAWEWRRRNPGGYRD